MVEVKRTLVRSIPELWEIVDGPELIDRVSTELFRSRPVEVIEREPPRRLAWQIFATPPARVELALAEKDWGTQVAIRVERQDGAPEFAGEILKRLLGELGSDQRQPLPSHKRGPGSGEAAASAQRRRARATARARGGDARPRPRDIDELSARVVRRACDRIERTVRALEHRLDAAEEAMRSEVDEAERVGRARFKEAPERLLEGEGQSELALAQQRRTIETRAAEHRLAKRAVESFARFEREVGQLQERARRVVAAAASEEVDRCLEGSIAPMLQQIEARLSEIMRGSSDAIPTAGVTDSTWEPTRSRGVPLVDSPPLEITVEPNPA